MVDVMSQPSSDFGFTMASSHIDSDIEVNELPFVDASEQPLAENFQLPTNPFPWTAEDGLQSSISGASENAAKHRKHKSLALPSFSFNPGGSVDTALQNVSPPSSPHTSGSQSSPSKSRHGHRRTRSEIPTFEMQPSPATASTPSSDKMREEPEKQDSSDSNTLTVSQGPKRGHKHRRSAAMSHDLTGVLNRSGSFKNRPKEDNSLATPSPDFGSLSLHARTDSSRSARSASPTRVSFADNVDVIPHRSMPTLRPSSTAPALRPTHSSDGIEPRCDRPTLSHRPATIAASSLPSHYASMQPEDYFCNDSSFKSDESLGDFPSVSIVEHADVEPSPSGFDDAPVLSENFDDDPTSAIEISHRRTASQPTLQRSPRLDLESSRGSDNIIDLDSANDVEESATVTAEDVRILRAKGFSAARQSMHSSGLGFDAPTFRQGHPMHRRTESAPSCFDRPSIPRTDTGGAASAKGFEIENVFEEEEEDLDSAKEEEQHFRQESRRKSEQLGFGLGIGSHLSSDSLFEDDQAKRSSVLISEGSDSHDTATPTNEDDIPSRSHTIRQASSNRQSLVLADSTPEEDDGSYFVLRPPQLMEGPDSRPTSSDLEARPISQHATGLDAGCWPHQDASSFGSTPNDQSHSSAWSTPKLDTAATSMSDAPQLNLPRLHCDAYTTASASTDGIPSLMSSSSTMSGVNAYAGSTASPSTPLGSQSRHSNLSMASQAERRRKRSSIVSLSHLMSMSRSGTAKNNLTVEQERCRTSSGLSNVSSADHPMSTPAKEKRTKRLSRALRFWKKKEEAPHG